MSHSSNFSLASTVTGTPLSAASPDQDSLARHVYQCGRANGVWHSVRCKAEAADGFLSGRFVSTIVAASALLAVCVYW